MKPVQQKPSLSKAKIAGNLAPALGNRDISELNPEESAIAAAMEKRVVLSLGQGSLQSGFQRVTAQLWEQGNPHPMKFTGALPAAPKIAEMYRNWQMLYWAMHRCLNLCPRIEIEAADVTNVSEVEFGDLCDGLAQHINDWLNTPEFRPIDQSLRTHLHTHDEICLVVETDDDLLQRLPWHLWGDAYRYAETALSLSSYRRVQAAPPSDRPVTLLVVLGNAKGIDVEQDRAYLSQLASQAEVKVLAEPSIQALTDTLWQGCDLLFFAGHSSTQAQGELQLNAHQRLNLDQLKYALQEAIARGLKLAIFNSCDGSGLARSLADLNIPQVMVMREPVPDQVAQSYLKYFLAAFTQGRSLYRSVRAAREQLQGLEADFPCASWLPVLYQNPAAAPSSWEQWRESRLHDESGQTSQRGSNVWRKLLAILRTPLSQRHSPPTLPNPRDLPSISEPLPVPNIPQLPPQSLPSLNLSETSTPVAPPKPSITPNYPETSALIPAKPVVSLEYPEGPVPLESQFYLDRPLVEARCYQKIVQPGSLLRIKAPWLMGKTSLIMRTLQYAESKGIKELRLDLARVASKTIANLYEFLRWFCNWVGQELGLESRLDDHWDEQLMSSTSNCTDYFETYLLPALQGPLALSLDNVDQIFPYTSTATDFFGMLRSWHEKGKTHPTWQNLRLVIAHSTEVYIQLNTNHSPFNVGVHIQLPELTSEQVMELANRHGLSWGTSECKALMRFVGGHPHLVRLAMYHIANQETTLTQLIHNSATDSGIYGHHLRHHWDTLQHNPGLKNALISIMTSSHPVKLGREPGRKLQSMGLIHWEGEHGEPSCNLYRQYFSKRK